MLFIKGLSLGLEVTMSYTDNPTTDRWKACALALTWTESDVRQEAMRWGDNKLVYLDGSYLKGPAGDYRGRELVLYRREAFDEQWRFLQEEVITEGVLGWIQGPPGTGKTTTTKAFCLSLNMTEWSLTFLSVSKPGNLTCVQVTDKERRWLMSDEESETKVLERVLAELSESKKHLVVLDGYLERESGHDRMFTKCLLWRDAKQESRRLAIVTSMLSRAKSKWHLDQMMKLREHFVVSWTLDEYLKAVENEELYELVKPCLDMDLSTDFMEIKDGEEPPVKEGQIRSKYYLSGGSCRYMLEMTGAEVRKELKKAIDDAPDIARIFTGNVGTSSPEIINRLIATFIYQDPISEDEMRESMPVSKYAARKLAEKAEVSVLKQLISQHSMQHSVLRGILFKMLFIKGLSLGLEVTMSYTDNPTTDRWKAWDVVTYSRLPRIENLLEDRTCLHPMWEFEGGYDGVIVDKGKELVQFVQLTIAEKHSFKLSVFLKALKALGVPEKEGTGGMALIRGWEVEIIFVTLQERREHFRVEEPKDIGALERYGWERGKERATAKIASFDFDGKVMALRL